MVNLMKELKGKRVIYSESHKNAELERYINDNLDLLQKMFVSSGMEFVYLPELADNDEDELLLSTPSYIVNEDEPCYYPSSIPEEILASESNSNPSAPNHNVLLRQRDYLDDKFDKLRKIIPDHIIEQILNEAMQQHEMLSHLVLSPRNQLILKDYDDIVIELTPIEMAFYLLYLRHPNGINFKDLGDHKDELWRYYKHASVTDDLEKMKATVELLIDPFSGSANQKRSRIARAINQAFEGKYRKELARYYTIEGARGEDKKIMLPRDLVVPGLDW